MYMPNIPRRKIYETMLVFEEGMIELGILLQSRSNFDKYYEAFHDEGLIKVKKSYREIKALLVMFLENRKYEKEVDFFEDMKSLTNENCNLNKTLFENKNVSRELKRSIKRMDLILNKFRKIPNRLIGKIMYKRFDRFNSLIPKILEIRRDHMK